MSPTFMNDGSTFVSPVRRSSRCRSLNDLLPKLQDLGLQVEPVAVHRVPPRLELAGLVPTPKRGKAHAEDVGGITDGEKLCGRHVGLPSHEGETIQP